MTKLKIRLPLRKVWLLTPVVALLFLCLAFVLTTVNHKQHNATGINEQINFQGRLLTSTGAVVPDGTYNIRFKIYQDGDGVLGGGDESLKWTETRESGNKVTVKNGYFSVYLGSVTALTGIDWNQSVLWLSIDIGGTGTPSYDGEMSPFTRLGSTPYALNSKQLGGIASTGYVQIGPSAAQGDASTNNSVFINKTTGTGNILELQKSGTDVFNIANNGAIVSTYSSTSATAGTEVAHTINLTDSGAVTTGSDDTRGLYLNISRTGASGTATPTTYGVYSLVLGDTGGTSTTLGVEGIAGGADTNYGVNGVGALTGSAIISETDGVTGIITSSAFTGTATAVNALQSSIDISTAGTYTTASGLLIKTVTASGGGAITTNYGAWIQTQTAGGSDYGLRVDTADTQTLWIAGNDASATTAAKGIAFGSARDVTLYRSAANVLQTDGAFLAGGRVAANSTGAAGTNEVFRVNTPNTVDNSTVAIITNTGANTNKVLTLQGVSGQFAQYLSIQNNSGTVIAGIDYLGNTRAGNGSNTAPGLSFQSESTLGLYRVSAGVLGITANGDIAQFSSTGQTLTGDLTFSTGATRNISVATSTTGAGNTLNITGATGLAAGVNNGGIVNVTGGTGGSSTGLGFGGAGGAVNISGGATYSNNWQGPVGGAVNISGGSPSASVNAVNSTGGAIVLAAGTGGSASGFASAGGGAGGVVTITAGSGGAAAGGGNQTGGNGAGITLTSGSGGASIGTAANSSAGNITLQAGSAGTGGSGAAGTPGSINLLAPTSGGINIGTNANAQTITIGNSTGATTVNVYGGTGGVGLGTNAVAMTVSVGNATGATGTYINAGTSGLSLGNNGVANTLQFGNTTGAVAQTINIGNNSTASSTNNVNIGSSVAGTVAVTGPTTVTGRTSGSSTALQVNNSSSTGSILVLQDNGSAVVTVADGGAVGVNTAMFGTNNKLIVNPYITVNNAAAAQITTANDADSALVLQGHSGTQSGNLFQVQKSDGTLIADIKGYGVQAAYLELRGVASEGNGSGINFYSNAGAYNGIFSLDGSGNMVFRNNNSGGGTYYDYNTGGAFWRRGAGATTVFSLADGGAALFQNSTNSATALQIKDSGSEVLLTADTTTRGAGGGNLLKVGNSTGTDGSTTMFQLDSATADPTSNLAALNGSLFYNSTSNKVKIIENGTIKTLCNLTDAGCGAGGATTLQTAYNNSSSPADITLADGKNLTVTAADTTTDPNVLINLQCVTSCSTNGRFAVQSAGTDVFTIAPTGNITATKHLAFGASGAVQTNTVLYTQETSTLTSGAFKGQENQVYMNAASNSSAFAAAADLNLTVQGTGINYTGTQYGVTGTTNVDTTGTVTTTMGLQGISNDRGNGTITSAYGAVGLVYNTSASGTIGTAAALGAAIANTSTGTITTAEGLFINSASAGSGTITTNYGIKVDAQTAGASDYGIAVAAADTQTLWLSSDVDNTTASAGIAFGTSKDTNLYRGAANQLKTDDTLLIKTATNSTTALSVQNSGGMVLAAVDTSSSNPSNLVTNPSFETNTTGWTARTGCTLSQDTSNGYNGTASGLCTNTATTNAGMNYGVSLSSTTTYNLVIYVKGNSSYAGFSTLEIGRADNGSTDTSCLTAQTVANNGWTRFVCSFRTGTVSGSPYIYIKQTDATARNWYVDAVVLQTQANADGNLYRDGKLQLNGSIVSPVNIQVSDNSSTAFTVNNSAGGQVFGIDTTDANQVTNPSFEVNTTGWAVKGSSSISRSTAQQNYGNASLLVSTTAAANDGAQYTLPVAVPVGQQVTLSGYVKLGATAFGSGTLVGGYVNGSGDNNCTLAPAVTSTVPTTSGWTRFSCTFTVASTQATAIYFKQTDTSARTFYVDAVQLENGATASPYGLGKFFISGEIVNPVSLKNLNNSTTAFQVFDTSNNQIFGVDTLNAGVNVATGTSINASNYGVSFTASDTNPTCNSGEYKIYADLSETKLKKCQNGTTSDVGAGDKYETFTGNGTYTKPSDAIMVIVQLWGSGGGGGGGAGGTNAAARTGGGGGGGGAFVSQNFLASNLGSSVSVTIGTGGTAGTAGSNAVGGKGGAGNPSCFSTSASCGGTMILRAYGGGGGAGAGAAGNGGGAGGGSLAVGGSSTTATGATGGSPLGAAAGAVNSGGGGAGGATAAATAAAGGASYFGGAGGGASTTAGANNSGAGGGGTFGGSGGGGGGSCAITTCTARTGGAGGANNNISGGGGAAGNGAAGGTGADGTGTGGAGGGGGGSSATVAGWNGGAGGAQGGGGGGGGAAHTGSTVGGAGAAGGRGEARIYSIRGSAADLAEIYGSYQKDIKPGELVCIDPNMRAGVKRCESKYSADAIGVVTTTPSIVIGNVEDPGAVAVPVVLSGRTPVLVSTENGPIAAGDLLTPSSTPGVAMKATKAGQIVGQAMGPYTSEGVGMTVAFIKSGKSLGTTSTIAQNLNINTYDSAEYGKDMLNYLINEQTSIADATNASEIFTDRLTAAIQVVTPELIAKNISTDSISSATGKDVNVKLKADGSLTVQDETGTKTSSIDDKGNATFTGTVKADKIIANQIEGIEIYTDNLLSLAQKQQSTSGVATAQSTSPPKTLTLDSFTSKTGVFEQDVTVTGNLKAVAGLHVDGPAEFMANSTFYKVALFIDKAIFRQNVEFDSDIAVKGDSTFSGNLNVGENTAGRAVIPAGQTTVTIVFKKPYNDVPIVNLTPVGATNLRYAVVDPQKDKFDIQIDSAQASDTTINWFVINIAQ